LENLESIIDSIENLESIIDSIENLESIIDSIENLYIKFSHGRRVINEKAL